MFFPVVAATAATGRGADGVGSMRAMYVRHSVFDVSDRLRWVARPRLIIELGATCREAFLGNDVDLRQRQLRSTSDHLETADSVNGKHINQACHCLKVI